MSRLDLTTNPPSAQKLVNLFFLGQYVIASLMAPSFAAGAITGQTVISDAGYISAGLTDAYPPAAPAAQFLLGRF